MIERPEPVSAQDASEVLYVAPNLATWVPKWPHRVGRDCQINDRCYRRLDPEYFAWLRHRMFLVKASADAGHVSRGAFVKLCQEFNEMQRRAIEMFGEDRLREAVRSLDAEGYRLPLREEDEHPRPVRAAVVTKPDPEAEHMARARRLVDEIREKALGLDWREERLYRSDGYGTRRPVRSAGLVCYIGAGKRLGEVTRQWIEIIGPPPAEIRTRFYNPDVEQPWVRCVGEAARNNQK